MLGLSYGSLVDWELKLALVDFLPTLFLSKSEYEYVYAPGPGTASFSN